MYTSKIKSKKNVLCMIDLRLNFQVLTQAYFLVTLSMSEKLKFKSISIYKIYLVKILVQTTKEERKEQPSVM